MMKYIITRYTNYFKFSPFDFINNNLLNNNLFKNIMSKKNDALVIYSDANSIKNDLHKKKIPFNEQWESKDFYKRYEK